MESEGWCGTPDLDSQLPDEFMPQFYKDYWSEAAEVSIDHMQADLLKLGDVYVLRRGDFLSLPLYVMSGVLKEDLAAHDRKASVEPRSPEAKYSFPPYEATATWLSRMRTDPDVAAAVVEQWWLHLNYFMGYVQFEHESTQLKFLALSRHTELVSAYCDSELKMDSAVLWRCLTAAQAFEQVHHSYREDPHCQEKREHYIERLNNVWPAFRAAKHEADSLKRRIRNAVALAHPISRSVKQITSEEPATLPSPAGAAPHPPVTTQSARGPLATWKEKLEYLQLQEAITAEPAQKFALKKQIEEAQQKIRQFGG
jgi:hypothetical protein